MMNQLREKHKSKEKAEEIKKWVLTNPGIELTFALADLHIKHGLDYLKAFPKSN
jgi:geranylgeranyl pyrophosphate synthase